MEYNRIIESVNKANRIIIFPHTGMDGDSVGSAKALALALHKMGKDVTILSDEPVPEYVGFLDCDFFTIYEPEMETQYFGADLAFAVDCSSNNRIENRMAIWESAKQRVCIDHHIGLDDFADVVARDAAAGAAALLVYDFIKLLPVEIDREMAEAIYTGILTDTGAFQYSSTDAKTLRAVAELYELGIHAPEICVAVYQNKPMTQLQMEAYAMDHAEVFMDGKAVISCIPYDYWNSIGGKYEYTENAINTLRSIQGTEVAAILKEKSPGLFKLSMRAKSYADVSVIAFKLGGGGHVKAAACTLEMSREEAWALVKKEIETVLQA